MPDPKDVYRDPAAHWEFLTSPKDEQLEGQHFDRKEVCRPNKNGSLGDAELRGFRWEHVAETVSAFANTNPSGGLLVLGIDSSGHIVGLGHLSEGQRNALLRVDDLLVHQHAESRLHDCQTKDGLRGAIALIYVPYAQGGICETVGSSPKAWKRRAMENVRLSDAAKEQLRRDKGIVEFERTPYVPYDPQDIDVGVLAEFRTSKLADSQFEWTDEELLYQVGALSKDRGALQFTAAGLLFFAANPQRVFPSASIRLLRFDAPIAQRDNRPLPTAEKVFSGPITKQLRDFRTFLRESAFFKSYQRRNRDGGFTEEPELPLLAVDESVVNAVAHRDYGVKLPILCEKYEDALLVRSPGSILQRAEVPERFSLDNTTLEHLPRNPVLMDWLKTMKDPRGASFVRALQEGTRQMRREMEALGLPAPQYINSESDTTVTLYNNAAQREAQLRAAAIGDSSEFVNLYPLSISSNGGAISREASEQRRRDVLFALKDKLVASGWYIDSLRFGTLTAHRRGTAIRLPPYVERVVRLYPAYCFQIREYWGQSYLVVDYSLTVQSVLSTADLVVLLEAEPLIGLSAAVKWKGWQRGRIVEADAEWTRVYLYDFDTEERVSSQHVIPKLPRRLVDVALVQSGVSFDLPKEIKRASLALQPSAARLRIEKTQATASELASHVFPLSVSGSEVGLSDIPLPLSRSGDNVNALRVAYLAEPEVEFSGQRATSDIRDGITRFGAYDNQRHDVELIPVCPPELRDRMGALIARLQTGKYKYRGAERTFSTRLTYASIVTAPESAIAAECQRLIAEHPEWTGDPEHRRLFLVHAPERGWALDDERSPYYSIKRILLEAGLPCQMVDTPTLVNPDYKDLNLGLNIVAKTGVTPWVLPDSIPDADFFIGLSYTEHGGKHAERLMGFANVFSSYGRWEFYSGSTEAFPFKDRSEHYEALTERTLLRLQSRLSETPSISFHYSAKFSREDRAAILRAARRIRPSGRYTFVWINTNHNVRLYDVRPESDGSLSRGGYVIGSSNQLYLSTTGFNPYRKVLGTPHALEINAHVEYPEGSPAEPPDQKALASQVLSLTKLNWASTDALCAEPITIKYASSIAYLTAAFLRQSATFRLHPVLERTPWFI